MMTAEHLAKILISLEGERLEFKEARRSYDTEKLGRYCCALANAGGGKIVLGVTDTRPRKIVGTTAFEQLEQIRALLMQKIPLRIEVTEVNSPQGRVLIFEVPARPLGSAIRVDNIYWTRRGESLVAMSEEELRLIFGELGKDFSATICPDATIDDISTESILDFRLRWAKKTGNKSIVQLPTNQLLTDIEVISDDGITYAALILFGSRQSLNRLLPQAEIAFEYRSGEASGPAQQRLDIRQGFFGVYDELWNTINLRNDRQHFEDGLFIRDIPTFDERAVREAILNAICHRDYQLGGSIFIRQYSRRLEIVSPGGFPLGISADNVLDKQAPRNRRVADVLMKCGLVERSGQGMNVIFERSIEQGKLLPDFSGTDNYQVRLTLHGQVQDANFVRFLEAIAIETGQSFSTHDLLVLDLVHREAAIPAPLLGRLNLLADLGVIERVGRGRGSRLILTRRFYALAGVKGVYTRKKGLDRDTNKALLDNHIKDNASEGSRLAELQQVLPHLSKGQIQKLLKELKAAGRIRVVGATKAGKWYPTTQGSKR